MFNSVGSDCEDVSEQLTAAQEVSVTSVTSSVEQRFMFMIKYDHQLTVNILKLWPHFHSMFHVVISVY